MSLITGIRCSPLVRALRLLTEFVPWMNQIILFFLCFNLNKKVELRNHQSKTNGFLLCSRHSQPQMGLQIAWWYFFQVL